MPESLVIFVLLRLAIGAGIGFLIGMTGVGGGILVLPALTVLLGMPTSAAIGTANFFSFIAKSHASLEHARLKNIDWRLSATMLIGAIPGTLAASFLIIAFAHGASGAANPALKSFQAALRLGIAWVMLGAGGFMIVNLFRRLGNPADRVQPTRRKSLGIALGFLVGLLIGMTSIGGGVVLIPVLSLVYCMSARQTIGTSIFVAVALTFLSSIVYLAGGQLDFATGLVMWLGSLPGVYAGARASVRFSDRFLKIVVVVLIGVSAVALFLRG